MQAVLVWNLQNNMITQDILEEFATVKNSLTPGEVKDNFTLTKNGVYLYRHVHNRLAEIIDFSSKEAAENYKAKCIRIYNKYFNA